MYGYCTARVSLHQVWSSRVATSLESSLQNRVADGRETWGPKAEMNVSDLTTITCRCIVLPNVRKVIGKQAPALKRRDDCSAGIPQSSRTGGV